MDRHLAQPSHHAQASHHARPVRRRVRPAVLGALVLTMIATAGLVGPAHRASAEPTAAPAPDGPTIPRRDTDVRTPTLTDRVTAPADRAGWSAALANPDGTYWTVPLLAASDPVRLELMTPRWAREGGGPGSVEVTSSVTVTDPADHLGDPSARRTTRPLSRADLDPASVQRGQAGTFWLGDVRGRRAVQVDATGRVLSAIPLGDRGGAAALAVSRDGRHLYPIQTRAAGEDDPRRRVITEIDTRSGRSTGRTWTYRVDTDADLVADAQIDQRGRLLVLERDDREAAAAVIKRVYAVELGRPSAAPVAKSLLVDLLAIDNPARIGAGDGWGTGRQFAFGVRAVDTLVPLPDGRLTVASTVARGDDARRRGTPDAAEMIIVDPDAQTRPTTPTSLVLGHRGASGYRPEHTLASYALAIRQCAAYIEPDVVMTRDSVPVVRHENEISQTTDVAQHPEFRSRRTTKIIDGSKRTGWFTEDFSLAELRRLRVVERVPGVRPANTAFDGLYPIPTLAEVLDLARHSRTCSGAPVGVAPETKHPSYFASIHRGVEKPLVAALSAAGLDHPRAPVIIQSFETGNLRRLDTMTDVRLEQLVSCSGAPWDLQRAGDRRRVADLVTQKGLTEIATYADVVGLCKTLMIPRGADQRLGRPTAVIAHAHRAGLLVVGWTFRAENTYLPAEFRRGPHPTTHGDLAGEIRAYLRAGMDGFFTDQPDLGVAAARATH